MRSSTLPTYNSKLGHFGVYSQETNQLRIQLWFGSRVFLPRKQTLKSFVARKRLYATRNSIYHSIYIIYIEYIYLKQKFNNREEFNFLYIIYSQMFIGINIISNIKEYSCSQYRWFSKIQYMKKTNLVDIVQIKTICYFIWDGQEGEREREIERERGGREGRREGEKEKKCIITILFYIS